MSAILIFTAVVVLAIYGHSAEFNPASILRQEEIQERQGLGRVERHSADEKKAIVDKHNEYRRAVNPEASGMIKMQWDDDLEDWAGLWASACQWRHGWPNNQEYTAKYPSRGQNMWKGEESEKPVGTNCVGAWHDNEEKYYDYRTNTCQPDEECGHYRLVVSWKTSAVGCARAFCDQLVDQNGSPTGHTNKWIEVCNYAPGPPDEQWKPYKEGERCSECKPGYGVCDNKLCKCNRNCYNGGTLSDCKCSCANGWTGDDCSQECRNHDSRCWNEWPTRAYCTSNTETFEKCPLMCNRCTRS